MSTFFVSLFMFQVEMQGMTGEVRFDQFGLRTGFKLDVMELKKYGLTQVS